jgi:hypothetical protein
MLRDGGYSQICRTVRHLIAELQRVLPEVRALIDDGSLGKANFEYPEFNNGCEIIP